MTASSAIDKEAATHDQHEYKVGTGIKLELPGQADALVEGVVAELLDDGSVVARFDEGLPIISKQKAAVRFQSRQHRHMRQEIDILDIKQFEGHTLLGFAPADHAMYSERRGAFRVQVAERQTIVMLGEGHRGMLQDVSAEGLGVYIDEPAEAFSAGRLISVSMSFAGQDICGDMIVRHIRPLGNEGGCMLGLSASDSWIKSQFTQIVMLAQRQMLKGGKRKNKKAAAHADEHAKKTNTRINAQAYAEEAGESKEDDRRAFRRAVFQFEGRAFVREEGRVRIIPIKTTDLSRGGVGLTLNRFIYPQTEILIEASNGMMKLQMVGHVRHCKHERETEHRVGVSFAAMNDSDYPDPAAEMGGFGEVDMASFMAMSA